MLRRFADGLSVLGTPGHFIAVFGWTLAHWLRPTVRLLARLPRRRRPCPARGDADRAGHHRHPRRAPSAPGFFGAFELGAALALQLYGVSPVRRPTTWALLFHVASFIPITVIGAYYATRLGLSIGDMSRAAAQRA